MDCSSVKERLFDYLEEGLSQPKTAEVKAHIDECAECRAEHADLMVSWKLLAKIKETDKEEFSPVEFPASLSAASPKKAGWPAWFAAAAAAAIIVGLVVVSSLGIFDRKGKGQATNGDTDLLAPEGDGTSEEIKNYVQLLEKEFDGEVMHLHWEPDSLGFYIDTRRKHPLPEIEPNDSPKDAGWLEKKRQESRRRLTLFDFYYYGLGAKEPDKVFTLDDEKYRDYSVTWGPVSRKTGLRYLSLNTVSGTITTPPRRLFAYSRGKFAGERDAYSGIPLACDRTGEKVFALKSTLEGAILKETPLEWDTPFQKLSIYGDLTRSPMSFWLSSEAGLLIAVKMNKLIKGYPLSEKTLGPEQVLWTIDYEKVGLPEKCAPKEVLDFISKRFVIVRDSDWKIRVWDTTNGKAVLELETGMAVSYLDRKRALFFLDDGAVNKYSLVEIDGKPRFDFVREFKVGVEAADLLSVSPDEKYIAVGSGKKLTLLSSEPAKDDAEIPPEKEAYAYENKLMGDISRFWWDTDSSGLYTFTIRCEEADKREVQDGPIPEDRVIYWGPVDEVISYYTEVTRKKSRELRLPDHLKPEKKWWLAPIFHSDSTDRMYFQIFSSDGNTSDLLPFAKGEFFSAFESPSGFVCIADLDSSLVAGTTYRKADKADVILESNFIPESIVLLREPSSAKGYFKLESTIKWHIEDTITSFWMSSKADILIAATSSATNKLVGYRLSNIDKSTKPIWEIDTPILVATAGAYVSEILGFVEDRYVIVHDAGACVRIWDTENNRHNHTMYDCDAVSYVRTSRNLYAFIKGKTLRFTMVSDARGVGFRPDYDITREIAAADIIAVSPDEKYIAVGKGKKLTIVAARPAPSETPEDKPEEPADSKKQIGIEIESTEVEFSSADDMTEQVRQLIEEREREKERLKGGSFVRPCTLAWVAPDEPVTVDSWTQDPPRKESEPVDEKRKIGYSVEIKVFQTESGLPKLELDVSWRIRHAPESLFNGFEGLPFHSGSHTVRCKVGDADYLIVTCGDFLAAHYFVKDGKITSSSVEKFKETEIPNTRKGYFIILRPWKAEFFITEIGEHQITIQKKDGTHVLVKFNLSLVGEKKYQKALRDRTNGEEFETLIIDLVADVIRTSIEEWEALEGTLESIRQREQKLERDLLESINAHLTEPGDPPEMKLIKDIMLDISMTPYTGDKPGDGKIPEPSEGDDYEVTKLVILKNKSLAEVTGFADQYCRMRELKIKRIKEFAGPGAEGLEIHVTLNGTPEAIEKAERAFRNFDSPTAKQIEADILWIKCDADTNDGPGNLLDKLFGTKGGTQFTSDIVKSEAEVRGEEWEKKLLERIMSVDKSAEIISRSDITLKEGKEKATTLYSSNYDNDEGTFSIKLKVDTIDSRDIALALDTAFSGIIGYTDPAKTGGVKSPIKRTRSETTKVTIKDGETFILGGLYVTGSQYICAIRLRVVEPDGDVKKPVEETYVVKGVVRDAFTGRPVEGAVCTLERTSIEEGNEDDYQVRKDTSDARGLFRIQAFDAKFKLHVECDGYENHSGRDFKFGHQKTKVLHVYLVRPEPITITGRVTDNFTKRPIAGATIKVSYRTPEGNHQREEYVSGKNGIYSFTLKGNAARISCSVHEYGKESVRLQDVTAKLAEHSPGTPIQIDFALNKHANWFQGKVLDAVTGEPVTSGGGHIKKAGTDSGHGFGLHPDGSFKGMRAAGRYYLVIDSEGYRDEVTEIFEIRDEEVYETTIYLEPETAVVYGRVTRPEIIERGILLSYVPAVNFIWAGHKDEPYTTWYRLWEGAQLKEGENYRFECAPGRYIFYYDDLSAYYKGEVTVKAGDSIRLDILLEPKPEPRYPCTVTGTVVDGITRKPFSYALVEASWNSPVHKETYTDENGRFKIEVPEGKVLLQARTTGSSPGIVEINLEEGETREVTIVMGDHKILK